MSKVIDLKDMDEDEQKDFYDACRRHGLNPDDFIVQATREDAPTDDIAPIVGNVTVSFRQLLRSYPWGHGIGPHWTDLFAQDAAAGVFA